MEFYEEKKSYAALQDNISVTTESLRDLLHSYMLNLWHLNLKALALCMWSCICTSNKQLEDENCLFSSEFM